MDNQLTLKGIHLNNQGIIFYKAGNIEKAISFWQEAAKCGNANALFELGVISKIKGDIIGANKCFECAIKAGHEKALFQLQNPTIKTGIERIEIVRNDVVWDNVHPVIKFGKYEWLILDKKSDAKLLLCKDIVDMVPYNDIDGEVFWECSSLRAWMNCDFIRGFSPEEKKKIKRIRLHNDANPIYGNSGGSETKDKIFALSFEELIKYYGKKRTDYLNPNVSLSDDNNNDDIMRANLKLEAHQLIILREKQRLDYSEILGKPMAWWLRTPGISNRKAMKVNCNGNIRIKGQDVIGPLVGVRPAMWIIG